MIKAVTGFLATRGTWLFDPTVLMTELAFVIKATDTGFLATGGTRLFDPTVPMTELHRIWTGIRYATRVLHLDHLIEEGDLLTVIT